MKWGFGIFVVLVYITVWAWCKAASKGERNYD